jgi:hypothetical protein
MGIRVILENLQVHETSYNLELINQQILLLPRASSSVTAILSILWLKVLLILGTSALEINRQIGYKKKLQIFI